MDKLSKFQELGYTFEVDANGYKVMYKGEFVYAAGVLLPRSKPLHWKHASKNRKMFFNNAISEAERHFRLNNIQ